MPRAAIHAAQPPLRFLPPRSSTALRRLLAPLLLAVLQRLGLRSLRVEGLDAFTRLVAAQQTGRCRLLIAFRHPSTTDPLVLARVLWQEVPRRARRLGVRLDGPVHTRFLYDRGIPLWAGPAAGWVLSRLGGIPIRRGRLDRPALAAARAVLREGHDPLTVAPEGATNNLSGQMAPLESGVAQLAFWCLEDQANQPQPVEVLVVPVGLEYRFRRANWGALDRRLQRLERDLGIEPDPAAQEPGPELRLQRLGVLADRLLTNLEALYDRRHDLPADAAPPAPADPSEPVALPERIERLRRRALSVAESLFGLPPRGTVQERCRRIEQAGWDRIYREDLEGLSAVARSLADWEAREADLRMGHMRLVEMFSSVSGNYVAEAPGFDRFAEVVRILEQALGWIEARPLPAHPGFGPREVTVRLGTPLAVHERQEAYRRDRRRAVEALTIDLEGCLADLLQRDRAGEP
ncbi:MAG: 1-acyl-sn-glycerol-3-phosphate acyltransferase [Prochlorococcaceae cyanobacterium]|jgi:1-acyl-sn-glycerol-3-phosphate acyltransferase